MVYTTDFEKEFAQRTLENLRHFTSSGDSNEEAPSVKFEVTQLINSLLGTLVFLHEKGLSHLERTIEDYGVSVEILRENLGFKEKWVKQPENSMPNVIWHMRNSLAHGHIGPFPETGEVKGVIFTDINPQTEVEYWKLSLEIETIKQIAYDMVASISEETENPPQAS